MVEVGEKIKLRVIWRVSKCGDGFHFRIPKHIVDLYKLKAGDKVTLELVEARSDTYTD